VFRSREEAHERVVRTGAPAQKVQGVDGPPVIVSQGSRRLTILGTSE